MCCFMLSAVQYSTNERGSNMLSMVGFGYIQIIIQLYNSIMIYKVLYLMETLYYRGVTINGHNLYCLFGWLS